MQLVAGRTVSYQYKSMHKLMGNSQHTKNYPKYTKREERNLNIINIKHLRAAELCHISKNKCLSQWILHTTKKLPKST